MPIANKIYKAIEFAYPTSTTAKRLDKAETGCWFVNQCFIGIEGSDQCKTAMAHNCEGYDAPDDPDLISFFFECEGELDPSFMRRGNQDALLAIATKPID